MILMESIAESQRQKRRWTRNSVRDLVGYPEAVEVDGQVTGSDLLEFLHPVIDPIVIVVGTLNTPRAINPNARREIPVVSESAPKD